MATVTSVKFSWNEHELGVLRQELTKGLVRMGYEIASRARNTAPYRSGALRNSIRVTTESGKVYVLAGGNFAGKSIPYAAIHEYGGWTGRGHATFIPERRYMRNASDSVLRGDINQYFKGF